MAPIPLRRSIRVAVAAAALCSFSASALAPLDIRVALVIGNSAYPGTASLENPANDAAAMSVALKRLGFSVIQLQDGSRAQMLDAIRSMGDSLRAKSGVGMLYYAGHGLQLDWRNYMVPVNATLATAADVAQQAVDVETVLQAFKAAGNRMNIVVLDACRDNPFSAAPTGKGLAQMDAPPSTFLAYATAPGNVAEDGVSGANGLYTGFLLRELTRPASKIEDIFKRVRLQVRQSSKGRQIPWESTSLEEDFFFNDGAKHTFKTEDLEQMRQQALARAQSLLREAEQARQKELQAQRELAREREQWALAAQTAESQRKQQLELQAREREKQLAAMQQLEHERAEAATHAAAVIGQSEAMRQQDYERALSEATTLAGQSGEQAATLAFQREKTDWDRIANSQNPDDFYEYLLRYPSGSISELASAALERLDRARITAVSDKDGMVQVPGRDRFRQGDKHYATIRDELTKRSRFVLLQVTKVNDNTVEVNNGAEVYTREGARIRIRFVSQMDPPRPEVPAADYLVGKRWSYRMRQTTASESASGATVLVSGSVRIAALENVSVPAGDFKAYRLELEEFFEDGTLIKLTRWMLPNWGFPIKMKREVRRRYGGPELETMEMTFKERVGA